MNIFKRFKYQPPVFKEIEKSDLRDKCFYRLAQWDWLNRDMIHVIDNNAPRMITMDPWPQVIYLASDGQMTVKEFIDDIASKFTNKAPCPGDFDVEILRLMNNLHDDKLIAFSSTKKVLPYYLGKPKRELDMEKAKRLMLEDGFIKE